MTRQIVGWMRLELAAALPRRIPCSVFRVHHTRRVSLLSLASVPELGLICLVEGTVFDTQLSQHDAPPRLKRSLGNVEEESRNPES